MRIVIIGGTRFIGPPLVQQLREAGHQVTLFHRQRTAEGRDDEIIGDKANLRDFASEFAKLMPEVAVHMVAFTPQDALVFVKTFANLCARTVVVSSMDVYRAFGRLHGTEPGPPDPTPLTEESPLRERPSVHGKSAEKRAVEEIVLNQPELPATVLRLPAVYGPGDHLHRFRNSLQRMADHRPTILMEEGQTAWRFSHGYVENVAAAIALAVTDCRAAGQIYNIGEQTVPTEFERLSSLGAVSGWNGKIVPKPRAELPPHLRENVDWTQSWFMDTSRIRRELGFTERVGYEDGLRATIAWERMQPRRAEDSLTAEYAAEDAVLHA